MWQVQDPERALALAYAPAATRPALALLWRLDEQLGALVARTDNPLIAQMRLTWWHEALSTARTLRPVDPLLQALADEPRIELVELLPLIDGWEILLDDLPLELEPIQRYSELRGATLFRVAARLLGGEPQRAEAAGQLWSLADLMHRISDPETARRASALVQPASGRLPGALAALRALACRDIYPGHTRRQGSPLRLLRAMIAGLTGL